MFTRNQQIQRYNSIWKDTIKNKNLKFWQEDTIPLYWIGIHLHKVCQKEMQNISLKLKKIHHSSSNKKQNFWLHPKDMHITLEIPGRLNEHFKKNDISLIKKSLLNITKKFPKFIVELGNINLMSRAIFREIYDKDNRIFKLHNEIASNIPFSLHPERRFDKFIPHMSIAYLDKKRDNLMNYLQKNRKIRHSNMQVNKIYFSITTDQGGKYKESVIKEYPLI